MEKEPLGSIFLKDHRALVGPQLPLAVWLGVTYPALILLLPCNRPVPPTGGNQLKAIRPDEHSMWLPGRKHGNKEQRAEITSTGTDSGKQILEQSDGRSLSENIAHPFLWVTEVPIIMGFS